MARARHLRKSIEERLSREWSSLGPRDDAAATRAVLCYPSPYNVGMSSLGFQAVLRAWNSVAGAWCDRAFLPEDVEAHRAARAPLTGYESGLPVGGFDLIGISLAYELELPGVVQVLELAGLEPLARDRRPADPPVIIGGPITFANALAAYDFADVIVHGEAEGLAEAILEARTRASGKAELLDAVHGMPGVSLPGRDDDEAPALHRAPSEHLPARSVIVSEDTELSGMFLVEPERGCHRGCTYCVLRRPDKGNAKLLGGGMRLVGPEQMLALVPDEVARVGLVGAAVTDHPKIKAILRALVEAGKGVGISSLRADRLDDEFVGLLKAGGYRTLTTASDGASERLRKLIRRGTKERHLIRSAELVRDHELRELKLYMMLGLPEETEADVDELVGFALELRSRCSVSLSIAPFVSKRNTPLDGLPFAGIRTVERRISRLKRGLKGRVEVRPTSARWAWVEHRLSQCGREGAEATLIATRAGGAFGAWKRAFAQIDDR
jgi:radical SAM superfamily enzyme YgiQ (UPF0313 family)